MGEQRAYLSLLVPVDFRRNFEAFAEKERRKPGSLACALLEWAFEQLQTAGSLTNLLKYHVGKRKPPPL